MTETTASVNKPPAGRARIALLRRLLDTVAMPASRISPQDRSLAGDILLEMLFQVGDEERLICSKRLQDTSEAPRRLMRYLAQCNFEVARPLLEENMSYDASDLIDLVRTTPPEHHMAIAARRNVPVTVSDALIAVGQVPTLRVLLNNPAAEISELGIDQLIVLSQQADDLCSLIVKRPEMRPAQAMAMFWWADGETRKLILTKHSADRMMLIDLCSDIFSKFEPEDWNDPVARTTLQMIERRQRNRKAIERSEFENLEAAIDAAAKSGMTSEMLQEIGYLAGIKPISIAKMMTDLGGEAIAVFCKGTGLKRESLIRIWRAMRRPVKLDDETIHPQLVYVMEVYDIMTVVKAQTVLRYWNWSLTAANASMTVHNDKTAEDSFSSPRRMTKLVFGN